MWARLGQDIDLGPHPPQPIESMLECCWTLINNEDTYISLDTLKYLAENLMRAGIST